LRKFRDGFIERWLILFVFLLAAQVIITGNVAAKDPAVKELLLSLVQPMEVPEPYIKEDGVIEKILSVTLTGPKGDPFAAALQRPVTEDYLRNTRSDTASLLVPKDNEILPGRSAVSSLRGSGPKLASLDARVPAASRDDRTILDAGDAAASAGRLVADPSGVFSSFAILVDRSNYTLTLYGTRGDERKLLYSCKVGLGSAEYPTPRGSYYALRIYDDKPLWIPPPSDWAYGASPSHSTYGGYMIPLFRKVLADKSTKEEQTLSELDDIASKAKIVDSGGYRLHGTDSPWSVGSAQSHGCVRMRTDTAKALSDALKMYVGVTSRDRSPNGSFVNLARPVKVTLF
jgi:lipoprotein-anchoring transpeptidase ErfK/SrfK